MLSIAKLTHIAQTTAENIDADAVQAAIEGSPPDSSTPGIPLG